MTEPTDIDALIALAKAATPGPWTEFDEQGEAYSRPPATGAFLVEYGADAEQKMRDIRFIATADPPAVLALIAELRQERERRTDLADEYQKAGRSWDTTRERLIDERNEARADLTRAREVIARIENATRADLRSSLRVAAIEIIIDQYKQNGADDDME